LVLHPLPLKASTFDDRIVERGNAGSPFRTTR
jgi:hypothetical protein